MPALYTLYVHYFVWFCKMRVVSLFRLHVVAVDNCVYSSTDCIYAHYRSGGRFLSLEAVQGKKLLPVIACFATPVGLG